MPRSLNATAASLLGFLHEGPMTGWDLVAIAQQRIGDFWSLTQSQVYRELATMAEDGLVEAGERGSRDKRPYAITPAGRSAFQQWVEQMPADETIRFPLLLTLAFGRHLPTGRLTTMLEQHRLIHSERLRAYRLQLEEVEAMGDRYARATLDFGITYEKAVLEWFDRLPKDLSEQ
ncbi:MAG TPA: PadR family transcriptional regulator [Acidimicrobiia bacterium]|nr:PadR family transcriptional regulator [Acidimicrobiia bacterium]